MKVASSWFVLLVSSLVLSGCLVNSESNTAYDGNYINLEQIAGAVPGVPEHRLLSSWGQPSHRVRTGPELELWTYEYSQVTHSNTSILFLFRDESTETADGKVFVELSSGRVLRAWRN